MTRDDREFWERVFLAALPQRLSVFDADVEVDPLVVAADVATRAVEQRAKCCPAEPMPPHPLSGKTVRFGDHGEVHGVEPPHTPVTPLASQRYALLARQLAEELGGADTYGVKKQVALKLDIHLSYVGRILSGGQSIGARTIRRARERLGLASEFFSESYPDDPHYSDFNLVAAEQPEEPTVPIGRASARYIRLVGDLGREMDFKWGWQSEAARRLGVSPSYVSKVHAGKIRSVNANVIERAIDNLALPPEHFFAEAS